MNIHVILREAQNMKNSPAIVVMQRQDGQSIALSVPREVGKQIDKAIHCLSRKSNHGVR